MFEKEERSNLSCRICLEDDVRYNLIAPCACRGSQKYVHRSCLDRWRSVNEARAFGQCTECLTHFYLIHDAANVQMSDAIRKRRYWFYVLRDLCLGLLLTQIPVIFIALVLFGIDRSYGYSLFSASHFASPISFYYTSGLVLSLSIVGIIYSVMLLCGESRASNDCHTCCCYYGYPYHPVYVNPCCAGDCRSESNDCGNDDGGKVLILIIIAIFALIGLAVSIFAGIAFVVRTMSRHMHVLHKKLLTSDYVVVDLEQTQELQPSAPPLQCDLTDNGVVIAQPYSGGDIELASATLLSPLIYNASPSAPPLKGEKN